MDNVDIIRKKCTGCGLCQYICPKKCIILSEHQENGHFYYPKVDNTKCILCGKCLKHCPVNNLKPANVVPFETILFYSKNNDMLSGSTSGGAFGMLAKHVLLKHGVVYGASWTSKLTVEHKRIDSVGDLKSLQKSKYIQSKIDCKLYLQLKEDVLNSKRLVLFSGTPCQCAAVSALFNNKKPSNLIIVDVICHGVPSQWLFDRWKSETESQKKIIIKSFSFRIKKDSFGVKNFSYTYLPKNNKKLRIVEGSPVFNIYLKSFYDELIFRESCYFCSFRGYRTISDLTIGDFWNLEKIDSSFSTSDNKSLLVINSAIGKSVIDELIHNDDCVFKKYPIDVCLRNNAAYFNNPLNNYSFKEFKKWEKNSHFVFYSFKIMCLRPYYAFKNMAKKLLGRKSPLLFLNDFEV